MIALEVHGGDPCVEGLESVIANDLLLSSPWEEVRSWRWKTASHINVLEVGAVVSLRKEAVQSFPGRRLAVLLDPRVAKCALAKGRSSARTLKPVLKRAAALQVVGGLFPAYGFAPTSEHSGLPNKRSFST